MKQLFLSVNDGTVKLIDTAPPTVKENTVLVETLYSAVSVGTERSLTSFGGKNLIQKAMERPDQVAKVVEKMSTDGVLGTIEGAFARLEEPMPMGYSAVGKILACGKGTTGFQKGDLVVMAGMAYHAEINRVGKNLVAKIPDDSFDIRQGALCAIGSIALEGIHQADVKVGETVAVIGLGMMGHIAARILSAYGCDVIAFDVTDKTLPNTQLKAFIQTSEDNIEQVVANLTDGKGVDKVIITASADSNSPMDIAASIVRDRGTICMVGVTKMNIDRRPYYEKELTFTIARSYGPGRYDSGYEEKGNDYPIGYVRFTEGRNLQEFVRLLATKRLELTDLITHEFAFEDAEKAYELITKNVQREPYIAVLLRYEEHMNKFDAKIKKRETTASAPIKVGLIGAGIFARNSLLPMMSKNKNYHLKGIATTGGPAAGQTTEKFSFDYSTNNYQDLLHDQEIDLIVISTGHNTHCSMIVQALKSGKHVYCEKPLCLTCEELDQIEEAYRNSECEMFCGLNRRYSPLVNQIKKELRTDQVPAIYDYLANAGYIKDDHWVHDETVGGGRIIGEAIHFIDTIQFLDGSDLESLAITFAQNSAYPKNDNAIITLRFQSGAIGNIVYTSMGSKRYSKEQLRIFSSGSVVLLDNYLTLERVGNTTKKTLKLKQDKGILDEYQYIADVLAGKYENTSIEQALQSHRFLLEALNR